MKDYCVYKGQGNYINMKIAKRVSVAGEWLQFNIFFLSWLIYLFRVALGLLCYARAFSSHSRQGLLFIAVRQLLIVVAHLAVDHRLQAHGLQWSQHVGSVVVVYGLLGTWALVVVAHVLSCSAAYGTFPDQGLDPCPLRWQADSYPLYHQGSPGPHFLAKNEPSTLKSGAWRYITFCFWVRGKKRAVYKLRKWTASEGEWKCQVLGNKWNV